jgi:hypothetical protein
MLTLFNKVNAFALAHKAAVACITLGTVSLVLTRFSPENLGYYYVFLSALGLQILFEQGMSFTVLQVISRNFSIVVSEDELAAQQATRQGLIRKICLWYLSTASYYGLFLLVVGTAYFYFFSDAQHQLLWLKPWIILVFAQCAWLALMPILLLREAQGRLVEVWICKLLADMGGFVVFATSVLSDVGLYSLAWGILAKASIIGLYFLYRSDYRRLVLDAMREGASVQAYWHQNFAVFQKRISYSWLAGYTAHHSVSLVLFGKFGVGLAGQFGASWQIIQGISAVALIPLVSKMQVLAANEAKGARQLNTQSFLRLFPLIVALALLGHGLFLGGLAWMAHFGYAFQAKFLSLNILLILAAIAMAGVVVTSQAMLVRTQLVEPYTALSITDCAAHFFGIALALVFNRYELILWCLLVWQYAGAVPWSFAIFSRHTQKTKM